MATSRIPNFNPASEENDDYQEYFPSVDTPKISYKKWLEQRNSSGAIFDFGQNPPEVAVVGAGAGGLVAAYELSKAGARVTVFEASERVGGRLYSDVFSKDTSSATFDIGEMGAMRFPPSEETFFYYLDDVFKISSTSNFPDPGSTGIKTLVSYKGVTKYFDTDDRFETVKNGYSRLLSDDLIPHSSGSVTKLTAPNTISSTLRGSADGAPAVVDMFQGWLDAFGNRSYYAGLYDIFSGKGRWKVPNDMAWTDEDFTKFAVLGIGSGGFGPQYPINFNIEIRLSMNAQETGQRFVPLGCSQLTNSFSTSVGTDNIKTSSPVKRIQPYNDGSGLKVKLTYDNSTGTDIIADFDRVIVATTTRSMEFNTNLANVNNIAIGNAPVALADSSVTEAIRRVHMQQASKIFVRTSRFWQGDANMPRVILSDTKLAQMYTLNYDAQTKNTTTGENENTGVVLLTYVWGDDAAKWSAYLNDPQERVQLLKNDIDDLMRNVDKYSNYSDNIVPLNNDYENNVKIIDWVATDYYHGAYTLSHPGGDVYIARMFYDFLKGIPGRSSEVDTGVYLAGDGIGFQGGWTEGALHTGLNAAVAVVCSWTGSTSSLVNFELSPANMDKVDSTIYKYTGGIA